MASECQSNASALCLDQANYLRLVSEKRLRSRSGPLPSGRPSLLNPTRPVLCWESNHRGRCVNLVQQRTTDTANPVMQTYQPHTPQPGLQPGARFLASRHLSRRTFAVSQHKRRRLSDAIVTLGVCRPSCKRLLLLHTGLTISYTCNFRLQHSNTVT